jgi:serine protease inhibitor
VLDKPPEIQAAIFPAQLSHLILKSYTMKTLVQTLLCSCLVSWTHLACQGADPSQSAEANNRFAQDLYSVLSQPARSSPDVPPGAIIIRKESVPTVFFSPYSIASALAMTCAGARGTTAQEMEHALHWAAEQKGTHENWAALRSRLKEAQTAGPVRLHVANSLWLQVSLPKFKITWGTAELSQPLQTLGIRQAFGQNADFSGMTGTRELFIGFVLHKAFVEVNEEGTEAAAATGVGMVRSMAKPPPKVFRADHPFLFLIREKSTGCILFAGRLADPS